MARLTEHLEARLGEITGGWSVDEAGTKLPFTVAQFEGGTYADVVSFATLGLSRYPLWSRASGRHLHLELMISVHAMIGERNIPGLLHQVGQSLIDDGKALLRGDVLKRRGVAIDGTPLSALYAALPVYHDEFFASCKTDEGHEVAIVWLIPIHASEFKLVQRRGWEAFEHLLQEQDPDLYDPMRPPLNP